MCTADISKLLLRIPVKSDIFLVFPTLSHHKYSLETHEANMRTMWRWEHSLLYLSVLMNFQHCHLAVLSKQYHTRRTLLPQLTGQYENRCCKAQLLLCTDQESPKLVPFLLHLKFHCQFHSHLELCTRLCTDSGLPRKHTKKYLCAPMPIYSYFS